jgi:hypothetical protein
VQQHGEQQSPENGNMCGSLRMQFHPTSRNRNINRHGNAREAPFHDLHAMSFRMRNCHGDRLYKLALDNAPRNANAISTNMIANCSPVNRPLSCCPSNEIKLLDNLKTNGDDSTCDLRFNAPPSQGKILPSKITGSNGNGTFTNIKPITKFTSSDAYALHFENSITPKAYLSNRSDHGSGSAGPNGEVFNLDESDMAENLMQLN